MSTPSLFTVELPLPDDTDRLGAALADVLIALRPQIDAAESGLAMRLEGDLGAGKTSLVRAMLRRLGWTGAVKSPTFTLLETYEAGGLKANHFDFYRFETAEEFEDAGFADLYAAGAVCASEWSSKAAPFVPAADLTVSLAVEGYGRAVQVEAHSNLGHEILRRWEAQWNGAV